LEPNVRRRRAVSTSLHEEDYLTLRRPSEKKERKLSGRLKKEGGTLKRSCRRSPILVQSGRRPSDEGEGRGDEGEEKIREKSERSTELILRLQKTFGEISKNLWSRREIPEKEEGNYPL